MFRSPYCHIRRPCHFERSEKSMFRLQGEISLLSFALTGLTTRSLTFVRDDTLGYHNVEKDCHFDCKEKSFRCPLLFTYVTTRSLAVARDDTGVAVMPYHHLMTEKKAVISSEERNLSVVFCFCRLNYKISHRSLC
jgi:hypothetical protein